MTVSILNDCLELRKSGTDKLQEYFKERNVVIFDAIFSIHTPADAKQIILYILCAYSEDSPMVILRQDAKIEQEGICEYLEIPEFKRSDLIYLKEPEVRRAVTDYMTQFSGPLFKSLMFMRIQLNDFELDITNREYREAKDVKGADGKVEDILYYYDIKEHGKAIAEHARLSKNIDALEKQLRAQERRMEGVDELRIFSIKGKETGKIKGTRTGNIENLITKGKQTVK